MHLSLGLVPRLSQQVGIPATAHGFTGLVSVTWESYGVILKIAVHLNVVELNSDELTHRQKTLAEGRGVQKTSPA